MSKTAVIYWSGTGNTEAMAIAVAEGAKTDDAEVTCFAVSEISADDAAAYDSLAFGCPAMGDEVLEESEFEPFFAEIESKLSGKNVALFGSYGWGDGEWMREWEKRVIDAGAKLALNEGLIINEAPDEYELNQCIELGKTIAGA